MYYYPNPIFYNFAPQVFLYQPVLPTESLFEKKVQCQTLSPTKIEEQKRGLNLCLEIKESSKQHTQMISRQKQQKAEKNSVDSDYEPENNEILIFYKKKNTQSNLSNQIYSFISSNKSLTIITKLFEGNQQKVEDFYKLIKKIKKTNKKYMNRTYIADLVNLKQGSTNFKIFKRSKCSLQIDQLRKVLRISVEYFFQNICDCGLLTSKKMNKDTLMEHFARKRQIRQFLTKQVVGGI